MAKLNIDDVIIFDDMYYGGDLMEVVIKVDGMGGTITTNLNLQDAQQIIQHLKYNFNL